MNDASTIEPLPRKIDAETIKGEILDKLTYAVGKDPIVAKPTRLARRHHPRRARPRHRPLDGIDPRGLPRPAPSASITCRWNS